MGPEKGVWGTNTKLYTVPLKNFTCFSDFVIGKIQLIFVWVFINYFGQYDTYAYCTQPNPTEPKSLTWLMLKGQSQKILEDGFFHQTTSPGSIRGALGQFPIWSNFLGVIRILNQLPGGISTRKSSFTVFFQNLNPCNFLKSYNHLTKKIITIQWLAFDFFSIFFNYSNTYFLCNWPSCVSFGSPFWSWITSQKCYQIWNRPRGPLMGPREAVWCKNKFKKSREAFPLYWQYGGAKVY